MQQIQECKEYKHPMDKRNQQTLEFNGCKFQRCKYDGLLLQWTTGFYHGNIIQYRCPANNISHSSHYTKYYDANQSQAYFRPWTIYIKRFEENRLIIIEHTLTHCHRCRSLGRVPLVENKKSIIKVHLKYFMQASMFLIPLILFNV